MKSKMKIGIYGIVLIIGVLFGIMIGVALPGIKQDVKTEVKVEQKENRETKESQEMEKVQNIDKPIEVIDSDKVGEERAEDTEAEDEGVSTPIVSEGFKVVGYFPDWKPDQIDKIQYDKLTHINYAFAIPREDGTVILNHEDTAKEIIEKAHEQGVNVLIAVGGWEYEGVPLERTFMLATSTEEQTKKLADEILKMVDEYGFDGVDMDWEHPRTDGNSKNQYECLMKYLREGLDERGKLLTSAVLAGVSPDGWELWDAKAHTDQVLEYVDWINVMAYDGGDGERHSSFEFAMMSSNYWLTTRGVPGDKIVLGIPFYSRPGWKEYNELLFIDENAHTKDQVNQMYYNGRQTVIHKTSWAKAHLGGVMVWELTQDTVESEKSLLNAINEEVHR